MATHLNDLASAVAVHTALIPAAYTADATGPTIDLISSDGPCFAVQQVGSVSTADTWTGRIEESPDGSAWSTISGATFATVDASNNTQVIRFTRTARYVRYTATAVGSSISILASAIIGEQKKTF
jgi:hypothetical protein